MEHCLIEAGLSGSVKVDSGVDASQGRVTKHKQRRERGNIRIVNIWTFVFLVAPKILEALRTAETYMDQTENFRGKVSNFYRKIWSRGERGDAHSLLCFTSGFHHSEG